MPSVLMLSTDFLLREKGGGGWGLLKISISRWRTYQRGGRGLIRAFTVSMKHFSHY